MAVDDVRLLARLVKRVDARRAVNQNKQLRSARRGAGKVNRVGSQHGQANGSNDDGQQHGEDLARALDLAARQHANTLPEGQAEAEVDDGVLGGKHEAEEEGDFAAPAVSLLEVAVEFAD